MDQRTRVRETARFKLFLTAKYEICAIHESSARRYLCATMPFASTHPAGIRAMGGRALTRYRSQARSIRQHSSVGVYRWHVLSCRALNSALLYGSRFSVLSESTGIIGSFYSEDRR